MLRALSRRRFVASFAALGTNALCPAPLSAAFLAAEPNALPAIRHGLVIMVTFPDASLPVGQTYVEDRFMILDRYVRAMSYGRQSLQHSFTDWRMMPLPLTRYAISPRQPTSRQEPAIPADPTRHRRGGRRP